jgi:hypothetical protein
LTIVSVCRHSKNLASSAKVKRTASVARLGLFFRSRYKASCFRRNRFSAASAPRKRSPILNTVSTPNNTRSEVRKNFTSRVGSAWRTNYMLNWLIFLSDRIFAEHRSPAHPCISDGPVRYRLGPRGAASVGCSLRRATWKRLVCCATCRRKAARIDRGRSASAGGAGTAASR